MDLHGDGNLDLISGSWPGEIFIFRGGAGRTFAPPEMVKDKWGEEINVGGGVRTDKQWGDGSIFVAGTAEVEETKDGRVIKYHGKRFPLATRGRSSRSSTQSPSCLRRSSSRRSLLTVLRAIPRVRAISRLDRPACTSRWIS